MNTMHHARALVLSIFLAAPVLAEAQTSTTTPAVAPSAPAKPALPPGFEPVPGGAARAESVDANVLVVAAYAAFFLGMFGFVIHVARRQAALSKDIEELSRKLEKRS